MVNADKTFFLKICKICGREFATLSDAKIYCGLCIINYARLKK